MFLEEGDHAVVQKIGRDEGVLSVIEFCCCHFGIGVDEGLLVDSANAFQIADIKSVLGAEVARVLRLDLPVDFLYLNGNPVLGTGLVYHS